MPGEQTMPRGRPVPSADVQSPGDSRFRALFRDHRPRSTPRGPERHRDDAIAFAEKLRSAAARRAEGTRHGWPTSPLMRRPRFVAGPGQPDRARTARALAARPRGGRPLGESRGHRPETLYPDRLDSLDEDGSAPSISSRDPSNTRFGRSCIYQQSAMSSLGNTCSLNTYNHTNTRPWRRRRWEPRSQPRRLARRAIQPAGSRRIPTLD